MFQKFEEWMNKIEHPIVIEKTRRGQFFVYTNDGKTDVVVSRPTLLEAVEEINRRIKV